MKYFSQCSDWGMCWTAGVRFPAGAANVPIPSRPALVSNQTPVQRVQKPLPPGLKEPGREADHSPPTSAVVNVWSCTSSAP